jgi:ATP adenylyltransferase
VNTCPFCTPDPHRVFHESDLVLGLWDNFPVSPGHALLVPRRHIALWPDATPAEQQALTAAISDAMRAIAAAHDPDGYNIGINVGEAAGQTVAHLHMHVIPRYRGDVADPRGGVRWVLPQHAAYWKPDK